MKKSKSIHLHLLSHYVFALMFLLLIIGVALYLETANVINQADYEFVADELNNLQYIMSESPVNHNLLRKTVIENPVKTHNSMYRYYVRVIDNNKKFSMETPGMAAIISIPKEIERKFILRHSERYFWDDHRGSKFLTLQAPIKIAGHDGTAMVQILLDTSYQHSITHDRRIFIVILFSGAVLSLLIGVLITQRGLRSLNALTETVRNITTNSLSQRIDSSVLPKELSSLGNAFNQMLNRIEASFSRLKQMSADMSHELRTPIMNLIGQTELLLSYDHSEIDHRVAQASNLEELQRMSSIIENILFLARAENPQIELVKREINAGNEIENICEYYQAAADEKKISLVRSGAAVLIAEPVMFRRLMSNIISNAVKYTWENGTISIDILDIDPDWVTILVNDNGIGIEEAHLPKLFDRFFRVDVSRSLDVRGSGLGLAIAKSIVDLHHGTINIVSTVKVGTTITIRLPRNYK